MAQDVPSEEQLSITSKKNSSIKDIKKPLDSGLFILQGTINCFYVVVGAAPGATGATGAAGAAGAA